MAEVEPLPGGGFLIKHAPSMEWRPIFAGDPPATFHALHNQCDEFLATLNQRRFGAPAEADLMLRWSTAMSQLSPEGQPPMAEGPRE